MGVRVLAGVTTAALAVTLAQPTDVVKVCRNTKQFDILLSSNK